MGGELVSPEETQEGKNTSRLAIVILQPLLVGLEEVQDVKNTGNWP